jgi:HEPN domain-containing protein
MKKSPDDVTRGWILKARSDLSDARRTLESEGPYDTACFHCQQAAEKYLKAFLSWSGKDVPRTHDIEELLSACAIIDTSFSSMDVMPEQLTAYAVEMRYDAEFWPDQEVAKEAIKQVEKIEEVLQKKLPQNIWKK